MKLKALLTGIILIASVWIFSSFENSSEIYKPRDKKASATDINGAVEYYKMLKANPITGEIDPMDKYLVDQAMKKMPTNQNRNLDLNWEFLGPDNVGGRTRAIAFDPNNPNLVFAGSVSGGLWRSDDAGLQWEQVTGFDQNLCVSSIAVLGNGKIYVGTGHPSEPISGGGSSGFYGNGLFKANSTSQGEEFELVSDFEPNSLTTSDNWIFVPVLRADPNDPNKVWIAYNGGLRSYIDGSADLDPKATGLPSGSGSCTSLSISGNTIVGVIQDHIYVSHDGGENFDDRSNSSGSGFLVPTSNVSRVEVAVSRDDVNYMYALLVNNGNSLYGVYTSRDGGTKWYRIAFDDNGGSAEFSPFGSASPQGWYDAAITVVAGHPDQCYVGGVTLHKWTQAIDNPPFGQWELAAVPGGGGGFPNPFYVHSDIHTFEWNADGVLYIGSDGGIFRRAPEDGGPFSGFYAQSNRGYSTYQIYGMAYGPHGEVLGGSQDNGTQYIDFTGNTVEEARQVIGSDGFHCAISQLNRNIMYGSTQGGNIFRSNDGGINFASFSPFTVGQFFTTLRFWETENDPNSPNEFKIINTTEEIMPAGTEFTFASYNLAIPTVLELPNDLLPGDSALFPDRVQTLFAQGTFGLDPVRVTRGAGNFSAPSLTWWRVIPSISGTAISYEFSPDGNHLYVGTSDGSLVRISGFNRAYTTEAAQYTFRPANNDTIIKAGTTDTIFGGLNNVNFSLDEYTYVDGTPVEYVMDYKTIHSSSGPLTGIAVDYDDPERLVIVKGGYGTHSKVYISNNAASTTSTNSFTSIWNDPGGINNSNRMPVYSCVINKNDPDQIIIGAEYGIFASDNNGNTWSECSVGMGRVPVFDLTQQTREASEVWNPGVIYAGTHGRGFFYSGDFSVGIEDLETEARDLIDQLMIYPNPMAEYGTVEFDLSEAGTVELSIYTITGQLAKAQIEENLAPGRKNIEFSVDELPAGTYLLNLRSGEARKFGKFIKY